MFADLQADLEHLPKVAIVAVGGLPIIRREGVGLRLLGKLVTPELIQKQLRQGLGLGAVLTYRNPKGKSLNELGDLCLSYGHLWTYHALSLTLVFSQAPLEVRNAFAFDGRFHLSWVDGEVGTTFTTFTAAGSLKQWIRMTKNKDDKSFKAVQREWFEKAYDILDQVLP